MALGKTHDVFNYYLGILLVAIGAFYAPDPLALFSFAVSYLFATYFCSPDLDLGAKKRMGIFRYFFQPYSWFFTHRGLSHHFLFGTLGRLIYILVLFVLGTSVLFYFEVSESSGWSWGQWILKLFEHFDYDFLFYQCVTWGVLGFFCADWAHLFLDYIKK